MEFIFALIIIIVWAMLNGMLARSNGRSFGGWVALSIFISPLLAFVFVCCLGKVKETPPKEEQREQQNDPQYDVLKEKFIFVYVQNESKLTRYCTMVDMFNNLTSTHEQNVNFAFLQSTYDLMVDLVACYKPKETFEPFCDHGNNI